MATTFKTMTSYDPKTIMIVDALNLAFRWKHAGATEFIEDFIATVNSLKKSYKAGKVIIACDQGSSSYRKNIFPDYKIGRKEKYEAQTEDERLAFEEFFQEFTRLIDTIKNDNIYPLLRFEGCEADDIAAYIVIKYRKTHRIWLMSSDKDWDLLVHENVSRFSYKSKKEIRLDNWNEFYEYEPEDHISIKCLMGDSGDSIPGVDGIGPVKAHNLVKEYGTAYDVAASLPINSKYKHIQNLNTFGQDNIIRNYMLMDLETHCSDALGVDNCKTIDTVLEEYISGN
jgi:5'-3' exonuclease